MLLSASTPFLIRKRPDGYTQALEIGKESIDIYVPACSPVSSYYDSFVKPVLSGCCEVYTSMLTSRKCSMTNSPESAIAWLICS